MDALIRPCEYLCIAFALFNGHQLAAAIKADAPDQPVILITAHADTLPPSPSVDFVVGKPFRLEHLREAIAKVMLEANSPA